MPFSSAFRPGLALFGAALLLTGLQARATTTEEILPLGDSLTGDYNVPGGYRTELAEDLGTDGISFNFEGSQTGAGTSSSYLTSIHETANEGHPGYSSEEIAANLEGDEQYEGANLVGNNGGYWLDGGNGTGRSAISPNIVLLEIGTNNASYGETSAQMLTALSALLGDLKTDLPTAQVIVGNLIPRTDSATLEATEEAYNAGIPALVAAEGSNFHFVDLHDAVTTAEISDGNAGVHPDAAGYAAMGDVFANEIDVLAAPEPSSIALFLAGAAGLVLVCRARRFC